MADMDAFGVAWAANNDMTNVPKPRGVFGEFPGATPKYARNEGRIDNDFRNTMAKLFLPVPKYDESFFNTFDDDTTKTLARVIGGTVNTSGSGGQTAGGPGYIDFLLQNVQHNLQERSQVVELLADEHVAYFFGQGANVFNYSGTLLNTKQDDQAMNMFRLYRDMLRGSKLASRGTLVSVKYGDLVVSGAIMNFQFSMSAEMEMAVPFSFGLLVKQIITLPNPYYGVVSDTTAFTQSDDVIRGLSSIVTTAGTPVAAPAPEATTPAATPTPPATPAPPAEPTAAGASSGSVSLMQSKASGGYTSASGQTGVAPAPEVPVRE